MPYADPARRREFNRQWMTNWRATKPNALAALKRWQANNPDYRRRKYQTDEQTRIRDNLRSTLHEVMIRRSKRDWIKGARLGTLVGCSRPDLIAHIEAQFEPGMTWENYGRGGWEMDHIRPCASFDLTDPAQQAACFHYTNLRPLWRLDNMRRPRKET